MMNGILTFKLKNDIIYFNDLKPMLITKQKTRRLCNVVETITGEVFLNPELYFKIGIPMKNNQPEKIKATDEEIKIYNDMCQKIYETYEPYNDCPTPYHNHELLSYIKETGNLTYDEEQAIFTCICTQNDCKELNLIKHKEKDIVFCIGSDCISKFCKELQTDINLLQQINEDCCNKPCQMCNCKLFSRFYKGNEVNFYPNIDYFQNNKICYTCWLNNQSKAVKEDLYSNNKINIYDTYTVLKDYFDNQFKCSNSDCNVGLHFRDSIKYFKNADSNDKTYCSSCKKSKEQQDFQKSMINKGYWKKCKHYDTCHQIIKFNIDSSDICPICIKQQKERMYKLGKWRDCKNTSCNGINKYSNKNIHFCKGCYENLKTKKWGICSKCNMISNYSTDIQCSYCRNAEEIKIKFIKYKEGSWRDCKNASCNGINKYINKNIHYCKRCYENLKTNKWRLCYCCDVLIMDDKKWKKRCYKCYTKND